MAQDFGAVRRSLDSNAHHFLQPSADLHQSFLGLAKRFLDPLAEDISEAQQLRLKELRQGQKRKRSAQDGDSLPRQDVLRMKKVHVDGFGVHQVWQQVQKILDAAADEIDLAIPSEEAGAEPEARVNGIQKAVKFADDAEDEDLGEEGMDYEIEGEDDDENAVPESDDDQDDDDDDDQNLAGLDENEDDEDVDDAGSQTSMSAHEDERPQEELVKDKFGLNDGFFSIDAFNKQSEFLERQDARGDPDDGAASDEEEVDWSADPTMSSAPLGTGRLQNPKSRPGDSDDDEGGATFGDADLDAPDTDDDDDDDEAEQDISDMANDFSNTNEVFYKDFFAPPARQRAQNERRQRNKPSLHRDKAQNHDGEDDTEAQVQRAMADVQRDLLDAEEDDLGSDEERDDDDEEADPNDKDMSSHEKRMKAFGDEIKRLEKENLEKREWALLGETVAPARPENALLEEDLDFERAGKPVPIATEEVNESIEDLIKRRILNNEFDELSKRRPELDGTGKPSRPAQREELSDTKPQRGLAEEYEDEYLRKTDPNYVDKRSEATKKAHALISAQWLDISAQLDALSNYHFKPKPPEMQLEVRTSAPTIQMEEARPTAGADVGMSGMAPQEVYKTGNDGRQDGEILTKGGTAISREEDSRENKRRRRQREKARAKKAGTATNTAQNTNGATAAEKPDKRTEKKELLNSLKKGNVKVIGNKGELQDIEGNAASIGSQGQAKAAKLRL